MNVHHLELFYYVAKHGGISEAARQMPWGIQQPAISGQILQLEEFLGVTLFQRRPFLLTAAGETLFTFAKPFFENLDKISDQLRGGMNQHIRIAAGETVIRDYLPAALSALRRQFPSLKVTLREGYFPTTLEWLRARDIDASIGLFGGPPPTGISARPLFQVPLVLLVPKGSPIKNPSVLWKQGRIEETLITVPSNEPICRALAEGLRLRDVEWASGIEVSTVELVQNYVAQGYGYGITVGGPHAKWHFDVRAILLKDFPMPTFGLLWQGPQIPILRTLLQEVEAIVADLLTGQEDFVPMSR
jgi:DNA-binding transcriptional LysR family regulator